MKKGVSSIWALCLFICFDRSSLISATSDLFQAIALLGPPFPVGGFRNPKLNMRSSWDFPFCCQNSKKLIVTNIDMLMRDQLPNVHTGYKLKKDIYHVLGYFQKQLDQEWATTSKGTLSRTNCSWPCAIKSLFLYSCILKFWVYLKSMAHFQSVQFSRNSVVFSF